MEKVLCLACGCLTGAVVWLLCGQTTRVAKEPDAWVQTLRHRARRALAALSQTRVVSVLLRWDSFAALATSMARRRMGDADPGHQRDAAAMLLLVGMLACLVAGLFSRSVVASLVAAGMLVAGVPARVAADERRLRRELAAEMPGVFRTLATAMASGHTLVQAIDYVGLHEHGHAAEAFVRTSLRLRCGLPVGEALERLRLELQAPGVGLMATALQISQRTGSPLRDLFQRSATLVEQQGEFERMLSVKTAQVRLSVRIVCLLPPAMVCLLSLISPDFQAGISTPSGIVCLAFAVLLDGLALLIIRRIMGAVL